MSAAKSISCIFVSSVSRLFRYEEISAPERKIVDSDEDACTANGVGAETRVLSRTVTTFEKLFDSMARGDTTLMLAMR